MAYDVALSVKFAQCLPATELNPIGRWLIEVDGGTPGLFMGIKWLCNLVMMLVLILLRKSRPVFTYVIAAFLLALLVVLGW